VDPRRNVCTLFLLVGPIQSYQPLSTTFFSVVFAIANSLSLQGQRALSSRGTFPAHIRGAEYIARGISDFLTSETGVVVVFESAIVPKWKDSRISFKNVYISRRPGKRAPAASKGDPHSAVARYDISNHSSAHPFVEDGEDGFAEQEQEDTNYAMFDLNVDSIDVTLSLWRWLDGKGLIQDAVIKGVRGVLG
jgi:distribution and morphology protein 31